MGSTMVIGGVEPLLKIDACLHGGFNILRQFISEVNDQLVFFFCITDTDKFARKVKRTDISHLSPALGVKWCRFQYDLKLHLIFRFYFTVSCNTGIDYKVVVSDKFRPLHLT